MLIENKKRLDYIDWAKAVSIILVVIGHMLPSGCWPKTLIYSFHVPIFVFVGGILFSAPATWKAFGKKLWGIVKRMLIPYIIWFVISVSFYWGAAETMPKIVQHTATKDFTELLKYFVFYNRSAGWNDPLWFMPCYIVTSCLFLLYAKLTKGNRIASGVLAFSSFATVIILGKFNITLDIGEVKNAFNPYNYLLFLGFLSTGYTLRPAFDRCMTLCKNPRKNPIPYVAVAMFVVFSVLSLKHNAVDTNAAGYYTLSMFSGLYNGFVPYISFALLLSITLLLSLMLLPSSRLVNLLSRNSLFIMITHYFFYFEISFYWMSKSFWGKFIEANGMQLWELDMRMGLRDGIFIVLVYVIMLFAIDILMKKLPKTRPIFGLIGIQ